MQKWGRGARFFIEAEEEHGAGAVVVDGVSVVRKRAGRGRHPIQGVVAVTRVVVACNGGAWLGRRRVVHCTVVAEVVVVGGGSGSRARERGCPRGRGMSGERVCTRGGPGLVGIDGRGRVLCVREDGVLAAHGVLSWLGRDRVRAIQQCKLSGKWVREFNAMRHDYWTSWC